eukprot:4760479-Prymnesium_polylepis.2
MHVGMRVVDERARALNSSTFSHLCSIASHLQTCEYGRALPRHAEWLGYESGKAMMATCLDRAVLRAERVVRALVLARQLPPPTLSRLLGDIVLGAGRRGVAVVGEDIV